jgi:hypothetical protein
MDTIFLTSTYLQNIPISYDCLFSCYLQFSYPINQPMGLGYPQTNFNAPSTPLLILYTLYKSNFIYHSKQYYSVMSAVELN